MIEYNKRALFVPSPSSSIPKLHNTAHETQSCKEAMQSAHIAMQRRRHCVAITEFDTELQVVLVKGVGVVRFQNNRGERCPYLYY